MHTKATSSLCNLCNLSPFRPKSSEIHVFSSGRSPDDVHVSAACSQVKRTQTLATQAVQRAAVGTQGLRQRQQALRGRHVQRGVARLREQNNVLSRGAHPQSVFFKVDIVNR